MTLGGSEVATFNFERIYLGAGVQVETFGVRALSLLSRSSAIIDTPIIALPGELGGFVGMFPFLLCVLCVMFLCVCVVCVVLMFFYYDWVVTCFFGLLTLFFFFCVCKTILYSLT